MKAAPDLRRNFADPNGIPPAANPVPAGARPEIFVQDVGAVPEERWVRQADNVSFLPLCFGVTQGYYVNLLRVRKSGVLSCRRRGGAGRARGGGGRGGGRERDGGAAGGAGGRE